MVDDKGIYPYVPDMVRFYLSEEPILPQVRTWIYRARRALEARLRNEGWIGQGS